MIIYKNTIEEFINDCEQDLIVAKILFSLKEKRGLNIGASSKERQSWNTLKEVAKYLNQINNKDKQYILLEFVIRDSTKRIDVMILGKDEHHNKVCSIIELKGWSKIDIYHDTKLLNPNVSYGLCNHPSYEAYDYYWILKNMYSDINDFQLYCYSFLPNFSYKNTNPLNDHRFEDIISKCESYCKTDSELFINKLKKHFINAIDIVDVNKLDELDYKPTISFKEHMKNECNDIRLIGSQAEAYEKFLFYLREMTKTNKKVMFLISGGAGSGKTVVAFKIMVYLRSQGLQSNLILPGPEFRNAIINMYGKKVASEFIKGANSFIQSDYLIVDEAHKATGNDNANIFYDRVLKKTRKGIICLIDDQQVINKKGITKSELKKIASDNGYAIVELNLLEQFRNGGDISYTDWLKRMIFGEENNQEYFVNNFFDFKILDAEKFNDLYHEMYWKQNVRLVSFWTVGWSLDGLYPTVNIGNKSYIWNPNWKWLSIYKKNNNKVDNNLNKLCNKLNFNIDKKGPEYVAYFNTIQGFEFDYIFVHVPKLFTYRNNEILVDLTKLDMNEMKSQIWSTKNIRDTNELNKKKYLNKLYFLNRLFVNLTRGTKGCYVYFEDKELRNYFESKFKRKVNKN